MLLSKHAPYTHNRTPKDLMWLYKFKVMGGATDYKVGVQNRIRERSERKKIICTPTLPKVGGGTSKQISVGAY